MAVVMGRAKELVVKREEEVLAGSGGGSRGRPGEAFPFQVNLRPNLSFSFCRRVLFCWRYFPTEQRALKHTTTQRSVSVCVSSPYAWVSRSA